MVIVEEQSDGEVKVRGECSPGKCTKGTSLLQGEKGGWTRPEGKMMKFTCNERSSSPDFRLLSTFLHGLFMKRWHTTWKQGTSSERRVPLNAKMGALRGLSWEEKVENSLPRKSARKST